MRRLLVSGFAAFSLACTIALPLAAGELDRTLTVTGQGVVAVETAIAKIRLGVSVEGESADEVQAEIAERTERTIAQLRDLDVDNLQTTGISLFPRTTQRNGARIRSVRGDNIVQFEVPIANAGATLDAAVAAGASRIDSVTFRPTDADAEAGRNQALRLAVDDAVSQAEVVLTALDLELASIRTVEVNSASNNPVPVAQFERGALSSASSIATPVVGGERTISATVTLAVGYE